MEKFDCCSAYRGCSEKGECIHLNDPLYDGCYYRTNLVQGKNYYIGRKSEIMDVKITIEAPELAKAILALAGAIEKSGTSFSKPELTVPVTPKEAPAEEPTPVETPAEEPTPAEKPKSKSTSKKKADPAPAPVAEEAAEPEEPAEVTLEVLRSELKKLNIDKVKELISAVGASKLAEVDPTHYAELYKKAKGA